MTNSVGEKFLFSHELKRVLKDTLLRETNLSDAQIGEMTAEMEAEAHASSCLYDDTKPSKTRSELAALQKAAKALTDAIENCSEFATHALFEANGDRGFSIRLVSEMHERAALLCDFAERTASEFTVPRRRPPDIAARHFAFHVARILEQNGLKPTTTRDGIYLSLLEAMFSEFRPTPAAGAHERHGRWALEQDVIDEVWVGQPRRR